MKKLSLIALLLTFTWKAALGQERVTDSLNALLDQSRQDTSRVLLLAELAATYQFFKRDTAVALAQQAVALAQRIHFAKGEIRALTRLGGIYRNRGEYSQAIEAYRKALERCQQSRLTKEKASTLSYMAVVYIELGEYHQALTFLFQARDIYAHTGQPLPTFTLSNMGHTYERLGKLDSALYYQQQALASVSRQSEVFQSRPMRAVIAMRFGHLQQRRKNLRAALGHYREAYRTASLAGDLLNRSRAQYELAEVYGRLHQSDSSLYYAHGAFRDAQRLGQKTTLLSASSLLANLYRNRHQPDSAFYYQDVATATKDSLFGPDKFRRLQVLTLSEQQRVQQLQQQQEHARIRRQRASLLAVVGVSLLIALVLWQSNRTLNQKNRQIYQQRYTLEQTLTELKDTQAQLIQKERMVALRAQMNPHFIFNCLNSIKLYTLQNDAEQASEYLTKFARLMRLVLENSHTELVSLRAELEALELYIALESMRFKDKLRYQLVVSPQIDLQYVRIPPLLLQPFVENAIWHGLMHKPEGGTVCLAVGQPRDNLLRIEITDDGVGRERAAELKSKSAGKHKSFGMQVTAERLHMINQLYNVNTHTQVLDLVDSHGEPAGTKVVLEIRV